MITRARVRAALAQVYDPELDESITSLKFVTACDVSADGDVAIRINLPTPQCAPNFAYLMAADAHAAVRRLPGVREVTVELQDHFTGSEINAAVARGGSFADAFPGETELDDLEALRRLFRSKALLARQARVCEALIAAGADTVRIASMRVAELPTDANARRCIELRAELGVAADPDAPAFVTPDGEAIDAGSLTRWLRMARLVRTSLDANGGICRSLLQTSRRQAALKTEVAG
jgi:metal-sulfur cluster biosynthetic enzyme